MMYRDAGKKASWTTMKHGYDTQLPKKWKRQGNIGMTIRMLLALSIVAEALLLFYSLVRLLGG